ncbi:MAG: bifunctional hexulose-6-phosphate synthase/ribonuclease regulator [Candidatus Methanospirare jalkutatii]|nr:bifunctional hexulose-6-phosphate synthase/ribonuclease regulator [Candidatus Methanospirare jalkutatii]
MSAKRRILQVALDVLEIERALEIGRESVEGGADWLEAGTPLIKSVGMDAIRALKREFAPKGVKIVADMKTVDTGAIEVEMAAKSGADVVIILAVSDDSTIKDAVRAARKYGCELMVDIINVREPVKRAKELENMGVDYICVHVGIDQQMVGLDPLELLPKIANEVSVPLAVAGGIDERKAADAVKLGAEIVIVGGNVTRVANVCEAARRIRRSMDAALREIEGERVRGAIESERWKKERDEEIREIFMRVSTPNISDAMHRKGVMRGIKPLFPCKIVGKAVTVQTFEGDWAKPVEAIDIASEGDVLVIKSGASVAVWGELASLSCKRKGIAGVVIDGAVRDVDEIKEMKFPVFASDFVPNAGEPKGFGEINAEIICGGQEVKPGDWIVGDENGVVVVPKERAYEIARRALEVFKAEQRIREEIRRGKTLSEVLSLEKWEKK